MIFLGGSHNTGRSHHLQTLWQLFGMAWLNFPLIFQLLYQKDLTYFKGRNHRWRDLPKSETTKRYLNWIIPVQSQFTSLPVSGMLQSRIHIQHSEYLPSDEDVALHPARIALGTRPGGSGGPECVSAVHRSIRRLQCHLLQWKYHAKRKRAGKNYP